MSATVEVRLHLAAGLESCAFRKGHVPELAAVRKPMPTGFYLAKSWTAGKIMAPKRAAPGGLTAKRSRGSLGLNRDRSLRSRFSRQSSMLYGGGETRRGTTEHKPVLREDE